MYRVNVCSKPPSVFEFKKFDPRLKSAETWFQLNTGLNRETLNTVLSGTKHIYAASQIKPRLKFFKFGL